MYKIEVGGPKDPVAKFMKFSKFVLILHFTSNPHICAAGFGFN